MLELTLTIDRPIYIAPNRIIAVSQSDDSSGSTIICAGVTLDVTENLSEVLGRISEAVSGPQKASHERRHHAPPSDPNPDVN